MIEFDGTCPDCGGFIFRPGPCGGSAQNIECVGCGSRFNVVKFTHPDYGATILVTERIPNDSEWREDMFPKVLQ